MAPQPSSKAAMASTTNLLFSAKSTRARIISVSCLVTPRSVCLSLTDGVVEDQGIGYYLLARLKSRLDFLHIHVVRQEISADHFQPAKLLVRRGNKDEIAIVHVHHRGGRHQSVHD